MSDPCPKCGQPVKIVSCPWCPSLTAINGTCVVCADTGRVAVHVATEDRQCAAAVAAAKPAQLGLGL